METAIANAEAGRAGERDRVASRLERRCRAGFTLVEIWVALGLTALLFALVNGLVFGLLKATQISREVGRAGRAAEFCLEMFRKEVGEIRWDPADPMFTILAGAGVLAYSTSRREVIARDDMPRGYLRVEWRYDAGARTLVRRVSPIVAGVGEAGRTVTTTLLDDVLEVRFLRHDGQRWEVLTGGASPLPPSSALAMEVVRPLTSDSAARRVLPATALLPAPW